VERAFSARLAVLLEPGGGDAPRGSFDHDSTDKGSPGLNLRVGEATTTRTGSRSRRINKSRLQLPETHRIRDREHVKFVAQQPCLVCGRYPADAHHLRFAQSRELARKVSDEFTVSLCRGHHREDHRSGHEAAWWKGTGIDPIGTARSLCSEPIRWPGIPVTTAENRRLKSLRVMLRRMPIRR
jgi:hypothetical protein